jgi:hypothetical protein
MGLLQAAVREARSPEGTRASMEMPLSAVPAMPSNAQEWNAPAEMDTPSMLSLPIEAADSLNPEGTFPARGGKEGRAASREVPMDSGERGARGIQGPLRTDSGGAPGSSVPKESEVSVKSGNKESARANKQPESESEFPLPSMFSRPLPVASLGRSVLPTYAIESVEPESAKDAIVSKRKPEIVALGRRTDPGTPSNFPASVSRTEAMLSLSPEPEARPGSQAVVPAAQPAGAENRGLPGTGEMDPATATVAETNPIQAMAHAGEGKPDAKPAHSDSVSGPSLKEILRVETRTEIGMDGEAFKSLAEQMESQGAALNRLGRLNRLNHREVPPAPTVRIGLVEVFITAPSAPAPRTAPVAEGSSLSRKYLRRA